MMVKEAKDEMVIKYPIAPARNQSPTPADILRIAIEQRADPQYMRELMALQKEWEANQARKEYVRAMAAFKAEAPDIIKDKHVRFETKTGVTEYDHATIGSVTKIICRALGKHGLSHRWDTRQGDQGQVEVSCIITHEMGHSERTQLRAHEDNSGGKNSIQCLASTVTYLQRYTLLALTGLAAEEADNDGIGDEKSQRTIMEHPCDPDLLAAAECGTNHFRSIWSGLNIEQRKNATEHLPILEGICRVADKIIKEY